MILGAGGINGWVGPEECGWGVTTPWLSPYDWDGIPEYMEGVVGTLC